MTDKKPKLCIDCRHYGSDGTFSICRAFDGRPNPINGVIQKGGLLCTFMRVGPCGWDYPRLWQAKEGK